MGLGDEEEEHRMEVVHACFVIYFDLPARSVLYHPR